MGENSEGQPDSGAPVFVDSSGVRRRGWRRLGLAVGVAGGGYALVVAVSVIGGNSEAPWGVLIPRADDGAGRVVPEEDRSRTKSPWADGARLGEPSPEASATRDAPGAGSARTPEASSGPAPAASASAETGATSAKKPESTGDGGAGTVNKGAETGSSGSTGGSVPADPSTDPAGGATGSPGTPADPDPDPTESSGASGTSLLEELLGALGGGTTRTGSA
ncbi:hypothetical protein [Streptomyces sp. WMMB 322]|uniref:hypothetical protein n=1 Tax=Streptomyces sp. WMMB 322 TaxID=1286821 RepID=UPI0006E13258|nr:hypothetical protein [Streptomyces sp. WMMB 322]SCK21024.1 hypothetical protein H180DRAFT_01550 [Streptomyces sp. WMMB 322]